MYLAERVRQILRDEETVYAQGQFWDIRHISLALNSAQNIFLNFCIRNSIWQLLSSLYTNTGFIPSGTLPSDYLHCASAKVGTTEENLVTAKLYLGGKGYNYRFVKDDAAIILLENLYFVRNGSPASGILYYYKKPSYIGLEELGDYTRSDFDIIDFHAFIYEDIITNQAAVLLSFKEIQTQRDFKRQKKWLTEMALQPKSLLHYLRNEDLGVETNR